MDPGPEEQEKATEEEEEGVMREDITSAAGPLPGEREEGETETETVAKETAITVGHNRDAAEEEVVVQRRNEGEEEGTETPMREPTLRGQTGRETNACDSRPYYVMPEIY